MPETRSPLGPLALIIALVGTGLGGWALFRSFDETPAAPAAGPAAVERDVEKSPEDAKAQACDAFNTVRNAVTLQTHQDLGTEPVAMQAVAANARLAMASGAEYLNSKTLPAVPAELASEIHSFTDGLQAVAMYALSGVTNQDAAQADRLKEAQETSDRIAGLCK